jgi:serine/threonine-protein kinase
VIRCPACSRDAPDGSRFCPSCASPLETPTSAPTETSLKSEATATSHPALDQARFIPGSILAKRYRIVGLLGRGGMGEIYRADDLKLGQPVALKLLPEAVQRDPDRLNRFLNEVKVALKVSHPNVCRVHDIGETDGQHYISMEYVDGEDLASLLRRIERLPESKAVQIARQLCAGVAAAHEQGILHRDLKPANVMIDGRGRAKITDFGLAGLAESIKGEEVRAGTPTYMAPEQLAGKEVTVRSDVYSLGLVLYELFTGKRAFEAATRDELRRMHEESTPTSPSSHVDGMDPSVERVILRCLEKDPSERPASALGVAAALPGGDPLAAALAAGETPSPEMVAAAGHSEALCPSIAVPCLVFTLVALVLGAYFHGRFSILGYVPFDKSREVLVDRAREIVRKVGYEDPPADTAHGFYRDSGQLQHVKKNDSTSSRWERLRSNPLSAMRLWYRQSPVSIVPESLLGSVSAWEPRISYPGEVRVSLDTTGTLLVLFAVPPGHEDPDAPAPTFDWPILLEEAGLDPALLTPATPEWVPLSHSDERVAWTGTHPGQPGFPVRVEAAAYRGRPVSFWQVHPWHRPPEARPRVRTLKEQAQQITWLVFWVAAVLGALVMTRRNLRLGRGDRKGAFRLAVFVLVTSLLAWLLGAHHVTDLSEQQWLFIKILGHALYQSAFIWVVYIALEPFVRRQWPETIVSWTRLLSGRFRDPLVGRHVLCGAAVGVALVLIDALGHVAPTWFGWPTDTPWGLDYHTLDGAWSIAAEFLSDMYSHLRAPIYLIFLIALIRVAVRKLWIAMLLLLLLLSVMNSLGSDYFLIGFVSQAAWGALGLYCVVRFGLVGAVSAHFFSTLASTFPLTLDTSVWYWDGSLAGLLVGAAVAVYAFYVALAGKPLLPTAVLPRN